MSHRVAGPLYKLTQFFQLAKQGDLHTELYFREKDHFKEIADEYNQMITAIRSRQEKAIAELNQALQIGDENTKKRIQNARELLTSKKVES